MPSYTRYGFANGSYLKIRISIVSIRYRIPSVCGSFNYNWKYVLLTFPVKTFKRSDGVRVCKMFREFLINRTLSNCFRACIRSKGVFNGYFFIFIIFFLNFYSHLNLLYIYIYTHIYSLYCK